MLYGFEHLSNSSEDEEEIHELIIDCSAQSVKEIQGHAIKGVAKLFLARVLNDLLVSISFMKRKEGG